MKRYHWFFNYEQKEWRIVADTFEDAKNGLAHLVGKTYEELSTPEIRDEKRVHGPFVRFDRVEDEAGTVIFRAPTA